MPEISDEAWLELVEYLAEIDAGDEIQFASLTTDDLGESELLFMLDEAAERGMIRQVAARTWAKRDSIIDMSPQDKE